MTEEKKVWKREFSAGGIVYKKQDGQIFVLLIQPLSRNFGPAEGHWSFPKGKVDTGESEDQSAVREVREEAGVSAKIVTDLKSVKFFRNYDQTLKFVHYYLMEYVSGDPADHDKEVAQAAWFDLDEAESKLKYPHDKEIFGKAKDFLTRE
jgi:8-oxo-dGTP diphosphatase